jgi:hypothetical protein
VSRSLAGDESFVYRGVVVWRRASGTTFEKYVGPFVNRTAALQAANREIGSGGFLGWDEEGNRLTYTAVSKRVEKSPLVWGAA